MGVLGVSKEHWGHSDGNKVSGEGRALREMDDHEHIVPPAGTPTLTLSELGALEGFEQSSDTVSCVFQCWL